MLCHLGAHRWLWKHPQRLPLLLQGTRQRRNLQKSLQQLLEVLKETLKSLEQPLELHRQRLDLLQQLPKRG